MRPKQSICYGQVEMYVVLILRLLLIQSMNLFILATPLPPKTMSIWRSLWPHGHLSNRALSRTTKLILYKTLMLSVLLYGALAWAFLGNFAAALRVIKRKVLRKIFGLVLYSSGYCMLYSTRRLSYSCFFMAQRYRPY